MWKRMMRKAMKKMLKKTIKDGSEETRRQYEVSDTARNCTSVVIVLRKPFARYIDFIYLFVFFSKIDFWQEDTIFLNKLGFELAILNLLYWILYFCYC